MRTVQFDVPLDVVVAFSDELLSKNLSNEIVATDEDELTIEVCYEKDDTEVVDDLEDRLAELIEEAEEEDDEDDD